MAEGLLRAKSEGQLEVFSAGLRPDRVHPLAVAVMDEIGIDISRQRSTDLRENLGRLTAHYLIIVCSNAEENCPRLFPGVGERLFWPFDDPAATEGDDDEKLEALWRVRDEIDKWLDDWLRELET